MIRWTRRATMPRRAGRTAVAVLGSAALLATGCAEDGEEEADAADSVTRLQLEVLEQYPHDQEAFTQGLELRDGLLYESTGRRGESEVRVTEPETGEVQRLEELPDAFFGEGLTLVGDTVWQLTWQEQQAFAWDADTLAERDRVAYEGEGWGLCYDAPRDRLVSTDGGAELIFRDPETLTVDDTVTVTRDGEELPEVNELECVEEHVWANVWHSDDIVRIDPDTGEVTAVVDASGLLSEQERAEADVLNGIAALPESDRFYITGKLWPTMFLVEFVPAE